METLKTALVAMIPVALGVAVGIIVASKLQKSIPALA